ncbi:superoxide dismutase family protein [Allostreptomyces psammosilenae]|uniref:Cu-Zn family superoxide dismutase n=1 Tax=Allostreptomyces psammosilenae TaxID=1892865 RepID=A0A852ZNN3_9ACTN|nr:superoxide dismutase family protein [Allostreptomyces psammosilenae]NYI03285.1 Cu-Zn family superoxide dismutase [Allostreptomyces psammosilenae]
MAALPIALLPLVLAATTAPAPIVVRAQFEAPTDPARQQAVSYVPELVPIGTTARVRVVEAPSGTHVSLRISGLLPDRDYGAHVHTSPCGADPADAGPHYQHVPDPVQPSTDPAYANSANEVWLDFTTNHHGHGQVDTHVHWTPREGEARSIVLHDHHTSLTPGEAGTAGDRLACVNVPF